MSTVSLASSTSDGASTGNMSVSSQRETNTFDKCPRCRLPYDFLKRTNNASSKVPLILNCKHTVCEDCIRRVCLANPANAACPVCNEKFLVPRAQIDLLTEVFHPHFALIGQMMWTKNSPNKRNINWVSTGITLKNRHIENSEVNSEADVSDNFEMDSVDGDFESNMLSLEFEKKCRAHFNSFLNILCETCDETTCCYCFVEKHGGHTPVYLYKLSTEEEADMKLLKRDMELVHKHLQASQKKIKQLKNFDLTYVESEIKTCFADLHAKLHLAERNLRKKLLTLKTDEPNLGIINPTLKSGLTRVEQTLKFLNMEFNGNDNQKINVRALYDEIQNLKQIPCRLVSDSESLESVEFVCKNSFDRIEENFDLKRTEGLEYTLIPIQDWTHKEVQACIRDRPCDNAVPSPKVLPMEVDSPAFYRSGNSTGTVKRPRANEAKIKVTVTHINSLNSFYVQQLNEQGPLKQMNKYIETKPKRKLSCNDIKTGRIYGVKYEIKNKTHWRRGKLLSWLKKGVNVLFRVFFIDYGNTQDVTVDKLKEVDEWVFRKPPHCFECKLTNPNNDDFGVNAHLHLPKIIGEKSLFLKFIHNPPMGIKEVDLLIPSSDGTAISVRDVLLNTSSEKEEFITPKNVKLYKNSKRFSVGQNEQVVVSNVEDPFNISVQLTHNKNPLEKMKREMAAFYNSPRAASCFPVVDTDVVVKYQSEFHRGTIKSVSNSKRTVNVYFVDWGASATVGWSNVYMLSEEFTKVECQAITVRLAEVQRENVDEPWPLEVCDFLREQIAIGGGYRMVVHKENPLEVALFKIGASADICMNTLLVQRDHAVSTGNITETLYWPNQSNVDEETDDSDEFCVQLLKKAENILVDDEDVNLRHKTKQIRVLRFEDPELIYVKYLKHNQEEEEMDKELQIHYSNRRVTQDKWRLSEKCVIYDSARSKYFRGIIKEPCGLNNYVVYLFDHARDIKVSKKVIYKHETYFQKWGCHVNKCRLSNIKPAGDQGKWSSLSLEILQKIFNTYKIIHMAVLERNRKDKIFSVMMWYSLNRTPKALEPSRYRFISINKVLLEAGVAFSSANSAVQPQFVNFKADGEKDEDEKDVDESNSCSADETAESKDDDKPKDWYDIILEDESLSQTWPKPVPIQNRVFDAVLTCVDNEGCCFIRDEELQEWYLQLEKQMNAKFRSLKLVPENVEWRTNERCSILYDDNWYRGTVLEVTNSKEVVVEMIDYGSEHSLQKNEIFKHIMFIEVPPLVNKVRLYDVHPRRGAWNADDVQELLEVVEDNVKVVLKSELNIDIPEVEIYLESGLSVNDLIVQRCSHLVRYENKVALVNGDEIEDYVEYTEEEDPAQSDGASDGTKELNCSQDVLSYTYVELPKSPNRKCKMTVLNVLKSNSEFRAVLTASKDDNEDLEAFVTLTNEIQEHAQELPALNNIQVGTPCVCWHSQNKEWCRAQIYSVDSLSFNYVSAFFVDYGTVYTVDTDKLKEIRPEWLNLPLSIYMALINIELMDSDRVEHVTMQLNNLKGNVVTVEIVSEEPLKVHLYDDKNLCYQNFINCGIIRAI